MNINSNLSCGSYSPLRLEWKSKDEPDHWSIDFQQSPNMTVVVVGKPKFDEILDCVSRLVLPSHALAQVIAIVIASGEINDTTSRLS